MKQVFIVKIIEDTNMYPENEYNIFDTYEEAKNFYNITIEKHLEEQAEENDCSIEEIRDDCQDDIANDALDSFFDNEAGWAIYIDAGKYHHDIQLSDVYFELVSIRKGTNIKETEKYTDIDAVRSDFLYMTEEEPEKYQYVAINKRGKIDYVNNWDEWRAKEYED